MRPCGRRGMLPRLRAADVPEGAGLRERGAGTVVGDRVREQRCGVDGFPSTALMALIVAEARTGLASAWLGYSDVPERAVVRSASNERRASAQPPR